MLCARFVPNRMAKYKNRLQLAKLGLFIVNGECERMGYYVCIIFGRYISHKAPTTSARSYICP